MEQKLPIITKKVWSLILFMFKKGISKNKFLLHFNTTIFKRRKISGEYEFSCRNTRPYPLTSRRHRDHRLAYNPNLRLAVDDSDDIIIDPAVIKVLNMVEQLKITDSPIPVAEGLEDGEVDEAADKFIRRFYNDLRLEDK